jgi:hypothetical protein
VQSCPMSEGEVYGESVTYPGGHEQFWEELQASGQVPQEHDYINVPRGRVTFSKRTGRYSLLLDRCAIAQQKIIREIRQRLNLTRRTLAVLRDSHYRCGRCMHEASF